MFGLFKKKDPIAKLEKEYKILMEDAFLLSSSDRNAADQKTAEAEKVAQEIEKLKGK